MCDKRLWLILIFIFLLAGALIWRLFTLQVIEGSSWRAQAQGQQKYFQQTQGDRGNIYLRTLNGEHVLVATNKKIYHAYVSPREIRAKVSEEEERDLLPKIFAETLNIDESFVKESLERDSSFEVLKRRISSEEVLGVIEQDFLHLQEVVSRYYPEGEIASHVLGFVGGEGRGQYGVEQYYNDRIIGREGIREGSRSGWGFFVTMSDSTRKGEDIYLTIDYNIQHFTERALRGAIQSTNATRGTVLVGDPHTGEIIALANYPAFNPSFYSDVEEGRFDVFSNLALQETFEPGSVFKPITMAIALDRGAVSPEDTYYDTGEVRIHGRTIRNYDRRSYGLVDMSRILERSINTGIVHVKDKIGNEVFEEYMKRFGFFELTGIDLHGEVFSHNHSFFEKRDVNYATASYGQGVEVTAVQLFRAFSVLANGGVMIDPHILKKDDYEKESLSVLKERIISPTAATLVTEMMVKTIEEGFGQSANVDGYYVAGKTGTAQVTWSKLGLPGTGYSDRTIQGFIGYAPAFNPEFVILVRLDEPQTRSAEVSAAPVFRQVAEYILDYKKIPYDYEIKND